MNIIDFKRQLNEFALFTLSDIRKLENSFDLRRLNEWQHKGYIKKVRRGYYVFSDANINEVKLYLISNKLYEPSYVSLESALSYWGLIPEGVYTITAVSTKKTESFKTVLGNFSYRSVRPGAFFGYRFVKVGGQNYKIADMEKAVIDYFYLNPKMSDEANFSEWRFDYPEFSAKVDIEKMRRYLDNLGSPSTTTRVKRFLKYMERENGNTCRN